MLTASASLRLQVVGETFATPNSTATYSPEGVVDCQPKLHHWADLIASGHADDFKEMALLAQRLIVGSRG